jgi:hypothetical protein
LEDDEKETWKQHGDEAERVSRDALDEAGTSALLRLEVSLQPSISLALWANHVPILYEFQIANTGHAPVENLVIGIESTPPVIVPREWRIARLDGGQTLALEDLDVALDSSWLATLTEAVRGTVSLTAREEEDILAEVSLDVRFLTPHEWGGSAAVPDLLAAFVEPNDPAVPRILHHASDLLRAQGKPDSLEGYQSGSKARLWEQIAALWSAVCALDIRYVNPPPSFELTGQRIRPPRQIVDERLATCLDLTLLFAACLEHMGIAPLIVLTKGHALAGAWLSPHHDFGTSVTDDAPSLRNRLKLDDLLLFETTLCCQSPAPGFQAACQAAADQLVPDHDEIFELVIDIQRARQRRIRPLGAPLSGEEAEKWRAREAADGEAPAAGPPPIEEPPMLLEEDADDEPPPKTPDDRLERWKRRLLDISGRNRLLNLPLRGKRALRIDCPDLSCLAGRLLETRGGRKPASFRFHPRPDLMTGTDPRSPLLSLDRLQEDAFRAYAIKALDKGELLVALDEQELLAVLTEIYRAARTAQQEGGANTLFLTLGALRWRQKGKEKPYHAPIVLVPVVLDRPSVRSGFYLRARDDEVQVNFTLLEMLRQDFAIQIPEIEAMLPVDGDGTVDVKGVLDAFRRKLRDIPGWEVTEEVVLTNLSFAKYLMWKDLNDHAEVFRQNEIVRLLLQGSPAGLEGSKAGPSAREADAEPAASSQFRDDAGARLDDELAALDLAFPLEADSSQLRAIAAAA